MESNTLENNSQIIDLLERISMISKIIYEYYNEYEEITDLNNSSEQSDNDKKTQLQLKELVFVNKSLSKILTRYIVNSKYVDYDAWLSDVGDSEYYG